MFFVFVVFRFKPPEHSLVLEMQDYLISYNLILSLFVFLFRYPSLDQNNYSMARHLWSHFYCLVFYVAYVQYSSSLLPFIDN